MLTTILPLFGTFTLSKSTTVCVRNSIAYIDLNSFYNYLMKVKNIMKYFLIYPDLHGFYYYFSYYILQCPVTSPYGRQGKLFHVFICLSESKIN